jgi:hypothetical protein
VVQADNKDKGVRENALKVFAEAYAILGEQIWTLLKDVPLKVKGLLEQRFKQVCKKTGGTGGLNQSINSAKGGLQGLKQTNKLEMSNGGFQNKRMTVAPGLNSSLGGMKQLNFNKSAVKTDDLDKSNMQDSEKQSLGSSITNKLDKLDVNQEEAKQCADQMDDVVMQNPSAVSNPSALSDVFAGKVPQPQDDVDMVADIDGQEDEVAQVANQSPSKLGLQKPSAAITTVPKKMNNFVMDEDCDEIQRMLREAEDNLDADPEFRDQKNFILNHIQQLREGDLLKRVDSLVALNEVISATSGTNSEQPV